MLLVNFSSIFPIIHFTPLLMLLVFSLAIITTNLSGLLMISTVLQAGSVINLKIGDTANNDSILYGITVYHAMALVVIASASFNISFSKIKLLRYLRWPLGFLVSYTFVATTGSLILPHVFSEVMINDLIKLHGFNELSPLKWGLSHMVQVISLILLLCLVFVILILCQTKSARLKLLLGVIIGCALVLVIGFYEQVAPFIKSSSMVPFWANNPGYQQSPLNPMGFVLNRVGLPFSEPSYASAYLASMLVGTVAISVIGRRWWLWLPASFLCALGLINTLGSTGIAAAGIALCILFLWILINALRPAALWRHRFRGIIVSAIIVLFYILYTSPLVSSFAQSHIEPAFNSLIIEKMTTSYDVRGKSNIRAVEILKETSGLGVGMGSHRASSFFASILANTGIAGFLLFTGMLVTLLWRYWKAINLTDSQIFASVALSTATLAMGIGIPDLNMPMYWGFIILAFVFCPDEVQLNDALYQNNFKKEQTQPQVSAA
jgi:hypothetical protein